MLSAMDDRLAALARKYRTLLAVRREKLRTGEHTRRETMRELAREFPGSLRELDTLPLAELERRASALEAAAGGAPAQRWMSWLLEFHALLGAALYIKGRLRGAREVAPSLAAELSRAASERVGTALDQSFAVACARPPGGRLLAVVASELGTRFGESPEAILVELFPRKPTREELEAARSAGEA